MVSYRHLRNWVCFLTMIQYKKKVRCIKVATNIFRTIMFIFLVILSYYAYKDGHPDVGLGFIICTAGYLIIVGLERIFSKPRIKE